MEKFFLITGLIFWTLVLTPILFAGLWYIWTYVIPIDTQVWIRNTLFIPSAFWVKNPEKILKLTIELLGTESKINKSFSYKLIVKILQWRIKRNTEK